MSILLQKRSEISKKITGSFHLPQKVPSSKISLLDVVNIEGLHPTFFALLARYLQK